MKKTLNKISYITKIFLVLGLLVTSLSPLKIVFAYEANDDISIELKDKNINVKYAIELEETDVIKVEVSENYTYLDDTLETGLNNTYTYSGLDLNGGVEIISSMLTSVLFDGLYRVSVALYNETKSEEIGMTAYSESIKFEKGIDFSVFAKSTNVEILPTDGKYIVPENESILIKSKILSGGIKPTENYTYGENTYTGLELVEVGMEKEKEFSGLLYGEYKEDLEIEFSDSENDYNYTDTIICSYGDEKENINIIKDAIVTNGLDEKYSLEDKLLYVFSNEEKKYSVNDLFRLLDSLVSGNDKISYIVGNKDNENLMDAYQEYVNGLSEEETVKSLEEFFKEVYVDNNTTFSLTSEDFTISFKCVVVGDLNDDGMINQDDIQELIDEVLGLSNKQMPQADLTKDDTLDNQDVLYLYQAYRNNTWDLSITEDENVVEDSISISPEDIASGDEITVTYNVKVPESGLTEVTGTIEYDKSLLELTNVSANKSFFGNNKDGKFIYALKDNEEQNDEVTLLTLKFKALKAGEGNIVIKNIQYANIYSIYAAGDDLSTKVIVNASTDNTLESLSVAGQNIALEDGILSYEITVDNATTAALVNAIAKSSTADITSITAPEELAEGKNQITIVVTAENGDELIYNVIVNREAAVLNEEDATTPVSYQEESSYSNPTTTDTQKVVVDDEDEEEYADETSSKSNLSKIIIIVLILSVVTGLIYLIFKDDNDDEESKKVNKEINKLKKEKGFTNDSNNKPKNSNSSKKKTIKNDNQGKNNKKER